jgi:hypothetical protein
MYQDYLGLSAWCWKEDLQELGIKSGRVEEAFEEGQGSDRLSIR